jgi:hypothetical protein
MTNAIKKEPRSSQLGGRDRWAERRRRADYHRRQIQADPEYAQVVRDSRKKWRDAHPGYQKQYWQTHPQAVQRNRQLQQGRDQRRRLRQLVKNNLALDLKHSSAEAWLLGPAARDLVKNNLASATFLIFQPVNLLASVLTATCKEQPSGTSPPSRL